MLAKTWKKIGVLILIIACLYNIMNKIVRKVSFDNELESAAQYYNENIKPNQEKTNNDNLDEYVDKFKEMNNYNTLMQN